MHIITFVPLEIDNARVRVAWKVEPPTIIYSQNHFTLDFDGVLDPRTVPLKLMWTAVILCLHAHWNLLRPCHIVLPVTLPANEIEFWLRLSDIERTALEMARGTTDFARTIEIECTGPALEQIPISPKNGRPLTAFSGGKDSLLQTALLCEFTECPLLVNIFAPMPPFRDHTWPFRQRALDEIVRRRHVELVIVKSDLNTIWSHYEVPHRLGYAISMGQLTQPSLYIACCLIVAYARGIESILLASEFEAFLVREYHGRIAHVPTILAYSAMTFGSYDRLFAQWGMRFGSLLAPMTQIQIQQLICRRYGDLLDLQISCFSMTEDSQQYCSRCFKCLRIALMLMFLGEDPRRVGIDVDVLFQAQKDYTPEKEGATAEGIRYSLAHMDVRVAKRFFPAHNLWQRLGLQDSDAYRDFLAFVKRLGPTAPDSVMKQHLEYLQFVPPVFHERLSEMIRTWWHEPDTTDRSTDLARIATAVEYVAQPLR